MSKIPALFVITILSFAIPVNSCHAFIKPQPLVNKRHRCLLLLAYGLAKLAELGDEVLFKLSGWISGYSIKYLIPAAGVGIFLVGLQRREPIT